MCHISEMRNKGDYRTTRIADKELSQSMSMVRMFKHTTTQMTLTIVELGTITYDGWATTEEPLHCEVKHGGMVWVTLNPDPDMTVEQWTDGAFDCIADAIDTEELEVFHYHKAVIDTNYKLWHDTNSEFYHDFMHYFNEVSGFNDEYFARKNIPFDNGHVNVKFIHSEL